MNDKTYLVQSSTSSTGDSNNYGMMWWWQRITWIQWDVDDMIYGIAVQKYNWNRSTGLKDTMISASPILGANATLSYYPEITLILSPIHLSMQ